MVALDGWPPGFPPATMRAETRAMAEAWVEVLLARLPAGAARAIHLKGSALKPWDTPIDYVPGLSDVDIHLTLAATEHEAALDRLDAALEVNVAVLEAYQRRVPLALHLLTNIEQTAQRERDREQLLDHGAFVAALPLRVIDRPGEYLDPFAGELNWRVSPVAPRILEILGVPYAEAWSLNRTKLVAALRARDLETLAAAYEAYYRAGWRRFLEDTSGAASLEVVRAGATVIRLGAEFAAAA